MAFNKEEAIKALAKHLGVDESEVKITYEVGKGFELETSEGEYAVFENEDDAREAAIEDSIELIDDMGLDSFSKSFQEQILDNSDWFNQEWLEDYCKEEQEYLVDDFESYSSDEYEDRLVEELYEAGLISDKDLHENEDGLLALNDDLDVDYLKEDLVNKRIEDIENDYDSYADWYKWEFGEEEFKKLVRDNDLLDKKAIAEECVDIDGIAQSLASYDGEEIELDNGYLAYRN